jgi:hypothetical protein
MLGEVRESAWFDRDDQLEILAAVERVCVRVRARGLRDGARGFVDRNIVDERTASARSR